VGTPSAADQNTCCRMAVCKFDNIIVPVGVDPGIVKGPGCEAGGTILNASKCIYTVGGVDCGSSTCFNEQWLPSNCIPCIPELQQLTNFVIYEDSPTFPIDLFPVTSLSSLPDCSKDAVLVTISHTNKILFDDNTGFVPVADPFKTGNLSFVRIQVTPNLDEIGTTAVSVSVRTPIGFEQQTVTIDVIPINDRPGLEQIDEATWSEVNDIPVGKSDFLIPLRGIHPGGGYDEDKQPLKITSTSSNISVIDNPSVVYTAMTLDELVVANSSGQSTSRRSKAIETRAVQHEAALKISVRCAGTTNITVKNCETTTINRYCTSIQFPATVRASEAGACTVHVPKETSTSIPVFVICIVLASLHCCCCCCFILCCCVRQRKRNRVPTKLPEGPAAVYRDDERSCYASMPPITVTEQQSDPACMQKCPICREEVPQDGWHKVYTSAQCSVCREVVENPFSATCGHIVCEDCLKHMRANESFQQLGRELLSAVQWSTRHASRDACDAGWWRRGCTVIGRSTRAIQDPVIGHGVSQENIGVPGDNAPSGCQPVDYGNNTLCMTDLNWEASERRGCSGRYRTVDLIENRQIRAIAGDFENERNCDAEQVEGQSCV